MRYFNFNLVVLFVFIAYSSSATAGGYTGSGTVQTMQSYTTGWLIRLNGANQNPDGCTQEIIILESTHPHYDHLYSMLLAAYTAEKDVSIYVENCDASGYKIFGYIWSGWNL